MSNSKLDFGELSRDTVESSNDVIFIVDAAMRIAYCNPAWDKFALANDGEDVVAARVVGTDFMRVIPEPLRDLYGALFQRCRRQRLTVDFEHECSSAKTYRLLHTNVLPLNNLGHLALVNSVRVERTYGAERQSKDPADTYISSHGIITMCSHCRRSLRQDSSGAWDWVPTFLQTKEFKISHGVCPVCLSYFYSKFYSMESASA